MPRLANKRSHLRSEAWIACGRATPVLLRGQQAQRSGRRPPSAHRSNNIRIRRTLSHLDPTGQRQLKVAIIALEPGGVGYGRRSASLSIKVKELPSTTPKELSHAKAGAVLTMADQFTTTPATPAVENIRSQETGGQAKPIVIVRGLIN